LLVCEEKNTEKMANAFRGGGGFSPPKSHFWLSVVAAYPLMVCVKDTFFSVCSVRGSSMEPTLKNGDILLIRKSDFPGLRRYWSAKNKNQDILMDGPGEDEDGVSKINSNNLGSVSSAMMRSRILREYEYQQHLERHDSSVWIRCPPWPMRGQIVTYRSPYKYPPELCIKRVIGVAGQVVGAIYMQLCMHKKLMNLCLVPPQNQSLLILCFHSRPSLYLY